MGFKKFDGSVWQPITPKKLKGIPYSSILPAVIAGTKDGYLHKYKIYGNLSQNGTPTPENPIVPSECGERTENLFDYTAIVPGYTYDSNGQMIPNPDPTARQQYGAVPLIEVEPGTTYLRTYALTPTGNTINFYDSDKNFLRQVVPGSGSPVTIPSNCNFVSYVVNIYTQDRTKYMFTKGSTAPTSYIPFGYKLPLTSAGQNVDIYIGDDTLSTEEYVDSGTGKIYRRPNSYDINATDTSKGYLSESYLYGNNIGSNPNWFVSEYMPILAGTDYIASGLVDVGMLGVIATINIYNSNKQIERYETIDSSGDTEINSGVNGAFIRISARNEHKNTVVVKPKNATPVDPPVPFPQMPTSANSTTISWGGSGLAPSEFDSVQEWVDIPTYTRVNGEWVADN